MPLFNTECLFSTVRNSSGSRKKFPFLPHHGRELDANEEMTVFGNILEAVVRGQRVTGQRNQESLRRAIENGALEIVSYPTPIVYDEALAASVMLTASDGSIVQSDPCFATSLSGT